MGVQLDIQQKWILHTQKPLYRSFLENTYQNYNPTLKSIFLEKGPCLLGKLLEELKDKKEIKERIKLAKIQSNECISIINDNFYNSRKIIEIGKEVPNV